MEGSEIWISFRRIWISFRRTLILFRLVLISFRRILNSFYASWRLDRGPASAHRGAPRRARPWGNQAQGRCGLGLSAHGPAGGEGARGFGDSGRLRRHRLSRWAHALEAAAR